MAEYEVIATRFNGSQLVIAEERHGEIGPDFQGFLYDLEQVKLTPIGPEVFKYGYWEESSEQIEVPNEILP